MDDVRGRFLGQPHYNDIVTKFTVGITESQERLPTFNWLPILHKRPYNARFIANSSSCTTTNLSKGVPTPTRNLFATGSRLEKKLKSWSGCKGRGKVFLKSPTSRRLKSFASCLLNMHKRLTATEFDREEVA